MSDAEEWWDTDMAAGHCRVSTSRFRTLAKEFRITSRREKRRVDPDAPTRRGSPVKEYRASEVQAMQRKREESPGRGNWGKGRAPTGGWSARIKKGSD